MVDDKKIRGASSLVIKYYIKTKITDTVAVKYEWLQCTDRRVINTDISASEAHEIINSEGLILAKKNKYGVVYDTPNKQGKKMLRKIHGTDEYDY